MNTDNQTRAEMKIGLLLLMLPVSIVLRAWVLTLLWGWFLKPAIGVDHPSFAVCCGLLLLPEFLLSGLAQTKLKTIPDVISADIISPLFILLIGWIIHQFA